MFSPTKIFSQTWLTVLYTLYHTTFVTVTVETLVPSVWKLATVLFLAIWFCKHNAIWDKKKVNDSLKQSANIEHKEYNNNGNRSSRAWTTFSWSTDLCTTGTCIVWELAAKACSRAHGSIGSEDLVYILHVVSQAWCMMFFCRHGTRMRGQDRSVMAVIRHS